MRVEKRYLGLLGDVGNKMETVILVQRWGWN